MASKKLHVDWVFLSTLGKPMAPKMHHEWYDDKPLKGEFIQNKKQGVAVWLDHHQRITAIGLHSKGFEKGAGYTGDLPADLVWATSRIAARTSFGPPESSGDAGGVGIMAVEFSWDRWALDTGGFMRIEYTAGDSGIRAIQFQEPPQAEPKSARFDVYADYSQFYVADKTNTCDLEALWDDAQSSKRQIAVGDGLIAIGTKRYGTVPVNIEWYPVEPKLVPKGIDRINECGLTITSSLVIGNYVSKPELIEVPIIEPGIYAVRVLYLFQKSVVNDNDGRDEYTVQMWPVAERPPLLYVKPK
jgi:hypothetical protein